MKLLMDTHTFIWWDSDPERLSVQAKTLLQDSENQLLVSVVSLWEMQIKLHLGKLKLDLSLGEIIESQRVINRIQILPIQLEHVLALEGLPPHHKDPFDRMLVAQTLIEEGILISEDPIFRKYTDQVEW